MNDPRNLDHVDYWQREWGWWIVIETGQGYKIKKILIKPECHLSNQYHIHREETWVVVKGEGRVTLDEKELKLKVGDYFHVPKECIHQVFNTSKTEDFLAIEIQTGEITSEYDIKRM